MSKTKQTKKKHPNQKLIDYFDSQAERELVISKQYAEKRSYQNAENAILRRHVWLLCAQITQELS